MDSTGPDLRALLEEIDRLVPKEGAKLRIPAAADGKSTVGTQRGYLRLGIEFLRAALAPTPAAAENEIPRIPLEIRYLLTPDSESPFELCEVDEGIEQLPARSPKLGALGQLFAALAAVVVLGLILVGAAAALGWIFR